MKEITTPSKQDALDFPLTGDIVAAGRFFGLGRDAAYRAIREGTYPMPVLKIGGRYRVTRASLLEALGIKDDQ